MEKVYSTGQIRRELDVIKGSRIHDSTWQYWRSVCGISGMKCTHKQWIELCACLALSKTGKKVNDISVRSFIRENGNDPIAFLPGLIPIGVNQNLPGSCFGADLPEVLFNYTAKRRSEDSIALYCKAAGLEYGRRLEYKTADILKIFEQFLIAQRNRRKGKENLPKRSKAA